MNISKRTAKGIDLAVVISDKVCITDVQTMLDFMMSIQHETGTQYIVINKEAVIDDFFILSTRIAGEILQKVIDYRFRLAIVGDFLMYSSKPLKDFMYESNQGKDIFFVPTLEDAIEKICKA